MSNNLKLVTDYYNKLWKDKKLEAINEYCDQNLILHSQKGKTIGVDNVKSGVNEWLKICPDLVMNLEKFYEKNDQVICEWSGQLNSKNSDIFPGKSIFTIKNNKIIEYTLEFDIEKAMKHA
jgi:hypothetical protein